MQLYIVIGSSIESLAQSSLNGVQIRLSPIRHNFRAMPGQLVNPQSTAE